MRVPNDIRLAEEVGEIDIILGGHDHDYEIIKVCIFLNLVLNVRNPLFVFI